MRPALKRLLWVGPDQLVYWGDAERLAATREPVVQIERRADNRGQTVLGGIRYVILHLAQPGSGERHVRLHVEGRWTLGQKRRVMDCLADQIQTWHPRLAPEAV